MPLHNREDLFRLAAESAYSANRLAGCLQLSRRQLERLTHKHFGRSPQNWLDEQRLIRAAAMLLEHRSVKSVSSDLGFKWVSHFSLKFKRQHQVSPTAFMAAPKVPADTRPRFNSGEPPNVADV